MPRYSSSFVAATPARMPLAPEDRRALPVDRLAMPSRMGHSSPFCEVIASTLGALKIFVFRPPRQKPGSGGFDEAAFPPAPE